MATQVDLNIQNALRAVSEALGLDGQQKTKDAYVHYLKSTQFIVQTLLQDADHQGFTPVHNTFKFIKLGQQCMDRVAIMADSLGKPSPSPGQTFLPPGTNATSPVSATRGIPTNPSVASEATSRRCPASPMEVAYRQNQQLMAAYKARMAKCRTTGSQAANMSLDMQRRMAENMAIAKAREAALAKKMQERQKRLQEQAAKRFASTTGMARDEQERRHMYTRILEYEQDMKWPLPLREKVKHGSDNIIIVQEVINKILSVADHPLTQLLTKYQKSIYTRLEGLVAKHLSELESIKVPYEGDLSQLKSKYQDLNQSKTQEEKSEESFAELLKEAGEDAVTELKKSASVKSLESETSLDSKEQGFVSAVDNSQRQVESAIRKGDRLTSKLSQESDKSSEVLQNIDKSDPGETYEFLDMDELFDDDEDFEDNGISASHKTNLHSSENEKNVVNEEPLVNKKTNVQLLKIDAYRRHLGNFVKDVQEYLEKLQAMFIVAYEELDSPVGKDLCYSCLEEPFFRPLWGFMLALFRLSNKEKEEKCAYVMTKYLHSLPADLHVAEKFQLRPDIPTKDSFPYEPAVEELRKVVSFVCPLNKLECLVRVSRAICDCVADYADKNGDLAVKASQIGADDLLPILGFVIVKSAIPQLVSECNAMEEFIHEGYLMGEEGYCLTSMYTALGYIMGLTEE